MAPYLPFKTFKACELNNLRRLQKKFKMKINKDSKNEVGKKTDGLTPLIRACRLGHLRVVRYLVTVCGADVHQVADQSAGYNNTEGMSPLLCAVIAGHPRIVRFLISAGADVNTTSHPTWTPLRAATHLGYPDIVEILLDNDADIDLATTHGHPHPLCKWTRRHDDVEVVMGERAYQIRTMSYFLELEMHVFSLQGLHEKNLTAFEVYLKGIKHLKAWGESTNLSLVVKHMDYGLYLLCEAVRKIDWKSMASFSGLLIILFFEVKDSLSTEDHKALSDRFYNLLELQRQRGVDEESMLHVMCLVDVEGAHASVIEMADFLIKFGVCRVNDRDRKGNTPLHNAAKTRPFNAQLVDLLIQRGAHIDMVNADNKTPIDLQPTDSTAVSDLQYPLRLQSLQCLAARAVCSNNIQYSDNHVPQPCIDAIKQHQRYQLPNTS